MLHDGMQARIQLDDGVPSEWFHVHQGLRQGHVSSPLFFNLFSAARVDVVFFSFVADPTNVLSSVYMKYVFKRRDANHVEEALLERVRYGMWGLLYVDDAGIALRSPDGFATVMALILVVLQEFEFRVSENKTKSMCLWSAPITLETTLHIKAVNQS